MERVQSLRGRRGGSGRGRGLAGLCQAPEVESVGVAFAMNFAHDVFVIVVAQGPAQLVVVHVGFALTCPPAASHLIRVGQLKLTARPLPRDTRHVRAV